MQGNGKHPPASHQCAEQVQRGLGRVVEQLGSCGTEGEAASGSMVPMCLLLASEILGLSCWMVVCPPFTDPSVCSSGISKASAGLSSAWASYPQTHHFKEVKTGKEQGNKGWFCLDPLTSGVEEVQQQGALCPLAHSVCLARPCPQLWFRCPKPSCQDISVSPTNHPLLWKSPQSSSKTTEAPGKSFFPCFSPSSLNS